MKSKDTFKDFLGKTARGKYMTPDAFLKTLRTEDFSAIFGMRKKDEHLHDAVRRWADEHAPDITLVDDHIETARANDDDEDDDPTTREQHRRKWNKRANRDEDDL